MPNGSFRALYAALIVCIFFFQSIDAFAQEDSAESAAQIEAADPITAAEQAMLFPGDGGDAAAAAPPAVSAWSIFTMVLTLALVAAAIYGLVYLFKRAARGPAAQDPFLKILASAPLGGSRSAHVLSLGSRAWLVGSGDNGVSLISEIDEKEILDAMLLEDSRKSAAAGAGRFFDFGAMLRNLGMPVDAKAPGADKIRNRRDRIKGL